MLRLLRGRLSEPSTYYYYSHYFSFTGPRRHHHDEADGAALVYGIDIDGDGDVDCSPPHDDHTIAWLENVNGDGSLWTYHYIGLLRVVGVRADATATAISTG